MGKQGPCYHCGVTSTPLWRNGPPEKPVLCNACGSRWRTKGTLVNYTPLHSRPEHENLEDIRFLKVKNSPIKNKDAKVHKRKFDTYVSASDASPPGFINKVYDEDISNRSSSGSAISNPESYVQYGSADASELTGPSQHIVWDLTVPSRKRTCVSRPKPSPVEKLTRDLYAILQQQPLCLSECSEQELLLETDKPMVSVEIGHGSVLIRHPNFTTQEEESVASSLTFESKHDPINSRQMDFSTPVAFNGVDSPSGQLEKIKNSADSGIQPEETERDTDKDQLGKLQILTGHNSPLCNIDLQDIINFDKFTSHLSNDEQQQLLKFLPKADFRHSQDTSDDSDRDSISMSCLKSMFDSPQFKLDLLSFQKRLADGVFNDSLHGLETEDLKRKRVEQYEVIKDLRSQYRGKESMLEGGLNGFETNRSVKMKRPQDLLLNKFPGQKAVVKSPRGIVTRVPYNHQELENKTGTFFSSNHLITSINDNASLVTDDSNSAAESSDQDLLLDIPTNGYFPQAELLFPASTVTL